jgi:hypothetical protein
MNLTFCLIAILGTFALARKSGEIRAKAQIPYKAQKKLFATCNPVSGMLVLSGKDLRKHSGTKGLRRSGNINSTKLKKAIPLQSRKNSQADDPK